MFTHRPSGDGDLLTLRDLPSGDRLIPDGSLDMRSYYVHMYLPPRLLPLYVFLVGRRQCCGAQWAAAHLDCCPRHPWSGRADARISELPLAVR